jgi:hypothetical protein
MADVQQEVSRKTQEEMDAYHHPKYDPDSHQLVFGCKCPMNMNLGKHDEYCCTKNEKCLGMFLTWEEAETKVMNHLQGNLHEQSAEEGRVEISGTPDCIYVTHVRKRQWDDWVAAELKKKEQAKSRRKWKSSGGDDRGHDDDDAPPPTPSVKPASYGPARTPRQPENPPGRSPYVKAESRAGSQSLQIQMGGSSGADSMTAVSTQRNLHHINQTAKHVLLEHLARVEGAARNLSKLGQFIMTCSQQDADTVHDASLGSQVIWIPFDSQP